MKIAVVGLGYWGPNRVRAIGSVRDASLHAVCDSDPERLARVSERIPAVHATTSFAELVADPELDAIILATPVSTHYELATRALEAGKHLLVEKPLASSLAEASDLFDRAERNGRVLMGGHTFLHSPPVQAVRKIIDAGELGQLYFITSSRVNLGLHQRDVSVLWDLAPHDFSIMRFWLGHSPESVSATGRDSIIPGTPDVAFVNLAYADGLVANLELSWLAPSKLRRTVIVGSERMVVYEDGSPEPVRIFDSGVVYKDPETFGEYHLSYRTGDIVSPRLDATEPIVAELAEFAEAVRRGSDQTASREITLDVIATIEAAERSLGDEGVRVPVERQAPLEVIERG